VYANPVKEIGWYEIELTPEAAADPLFEGCIPRQVVFQWHGDTFDLPRMQALGRHILPRFAAMCRRQ